MAWRDLTAELSALGFRQHAAAAGREEWRHPDGSAVELVQDDDGRWVFVRVN